MSIKRMAAAAAAAGLALACSSAASAACQLQTVAEVPVIIKDGEPLVDVLLNGRPVRFLIDTGAVTTMLSRPSAAELGLRAIPVSGVTFYGVGGGDPASTASIREIKLGAMVGRNFDISIAGWIKSRNFAGVLGRDVLTSHGDVELDLANHVVRFFQPKGCHGDEVVYWSKTYSLASIAPMDGSSSVNVNATLNGKEVFALLDTGATRSVVTLEAARQAGVTPKSVGVARASAEAGFNGEVQSWVGTFDRLSIGDETIRNAQLALADLFSKDREAGFGSRIATKVVDTPAMLLGADFIRAHRIYLAISQGKIYFTYNGGPIFQPPGKGARAVTNAKP